MKVDIIFKSKYACEKEWSEGNCNRALYEKEKAALVDWKKSHKVIRYLCPLVVTVLILAIIGFFKIYAIPSIIHRFENTDDFHTEFVFAVIFFLGILPVAVDLLGILLRKLNLKGPKVEEAPRWGKLELKYERYALIHPLLTSEEKTPIVIAAAASFGFQSVRNQDVSNDPNCIILDFDREKILFPTPELDKLEK